MFFLIAVFFVVSSATENKITDQIVTVFFQGNHASRHQAAKYTGTEGVDIKITDTITEHVTAPRSTQILYNVFPYKELNCISYGYDTWNPFHWLTKGLHAFNHWYNGIEGAVHLPHNHVTMDNIGGKEDIEQCVSAIRECIKAHPEKKIVLFGCSRGAATVVTSLISLTPEEQSHIKLVISEAPFDTVPTVVGMTFPFSSALIGLIERATLYKKGQESPWSAVNNDKFPLDIPIAFVASRVDGVVPQELTMKLVNVLKEKEHRNLHNLMLENSPHSSMSLYDDKDKAEYSKFIHSLYAMYIDQ